MSQEGIRLVSVRTWDALHVQIARFDVEEMTMVIRALDIRLRHVAATVVPLVLVAVAIGFSGRVGDRLADGLDGVSSATPGLLWLGGAAFVAGLVLSALAWRAALASCGTRIGRGDACSCYLTGSLVNAVLPAKLGGALRILLFSRRVEGEGALLTAGGAAAVIGATRALWSCILVALGAMLGAVPAWPALALGCVVLAAGATVMASTRLRADHRVAHLLDVFRALHRNPRAGLPIVGLTGLAQVTRYCAAAALLAAFGIPSPFLAALLVIPAVGLAGSLPLMPGNVGIASAAATVALGTLGVSADVALSAGIAYGGIELLSSIVAGSVGVLALVRAPGVPRRLALTATAAGMLVLGSAFGATVLVPAMQFAL
jgi:uncharacterized membrane protein YbhN (UPF0104 family)